ncbi:MAG: hypothetical protein LBS76_04065 [Mycoplasmataceae bacterium]|jgi:hypothetical protein|nr:hypothetical protein [Mycoplasmataceae bacterium]
MVKLLNLEEYKALPKDAQINYLLSLGLKHHDCIMLKSKDGQKEVPVVLILKNSQ